MENDISEVIAEVMEMRDIIDRMLLALSIAKAEGQTQRGKDALDRAQMYSLALNNPTLAKRVLPYMAEKEREQEP